MNGQVKYPMKLDTMRSTRPEMYNETISHHI